METKKQLWQQTHKAVADNLLKILQTEELSKEWKSVSNVETGLRRHGLRIEARDIGTINPDYGCLTPWFHISEIDYPTHSEYKNQEIISKKFCKDNNIDYYILVDGLTPFKKWRELQKLLESSPHSEEHTMWFKKQEKQIRIVQKLLDSFYEDYLKTDKAELTTRPYAHYYLFDSGIIRFEFGGALYNCNNMDYTNKKNLSDKEIAQVYKNVYKEVNLFAKFLKENYLA